MSNCGPDPESDPKQVEILEKEEMLDKISEKDWRKFIKENEDGK